jgi:transcriptional regulator with XRE-family HTH domain
MRDRGEALARFGRNLRLTRLGAGLTQEALARRAGLSRAYVSRLEAGKIECRFLTVMALADAVGVDLEALIHGGAEESDPDRGDAGRPGDR